MKKQMLEFGYETKHSVRYNAEPGDPAPLMQSVYFAKSELGKKDGNFPKLVEITVKEID